jgi:hypothetical protein
MSQRNKVDVVYEGFKNLEEKLPVYPSLLQSLDGRIDMYYPDEALKASNFSNALIPKYYTVNCNIFITLGHLDKLISTRTADIFLYRRKNKNCRIYKPSLSMSGIDGGLNSFSFELNAFNLVRNAENCKMVIGNPQDYILMTQEVNSNRDTEKLAAKKMKEHYDRYIADNLAGANSKYFLVQEILTFFRWDERARKIPGLV